MSVSTDYVDDLEAELDRLTEVVYGLLARWPDKTEVAEYWKPAEPMREALTGHEALQRAAIFLRERNL